MNETGYLLGLWFGITIVGVGGFITGSLFGSDLTKDDRAQLAEYRSLDIRRNMSETSRHQRLLDVQTAKDAYSILDDEMVYRGADLADEAQESVCGVPDCGDCPEMVLRVNGDQ